MNHWILLLPILLNATIYCMAAGSSSSITLRGSTTTNHLLKNFTCKLFLQDVEYEPTGDQPDGYSKEQWICELPKKKTQKHKGLRFVEIVDADDVISEAISGKSTLTVSEAIVDTVDATMRIPSYAVCKLGHDTKNSNSNDNDENEEQRNLKATSKKILQTLVIRVVNSRGVGPDASATKLRRHFFEDAVCLRSQYKACSYGQLLIQPFSGRTVTGRDISKGVVEVEVDYDGDNQAIFQNRAMEAANDQLGDLDSAKYDLIMFSFPPQTKGWIAYAFGSGKYSFCSNKWCESVSVQMHEVGHSLGLHHSGKVGDDNYSDKTGFMGISYKDDDKRMCFNPAKNYQLKWYSDQTKSLNPLSRKAEPVRTFKLNGVSDYGKDKEAFVVLRLEQIDLEKDYYIGFNRRDGINNDVEEDHNLVTIIRKESGGPDGYGQSMKVAALKIGDSYKIQKFNNDRDIEIRYIAGGFENKFAMIETIDINRLANKESGPCKPFTIEVQTDKNPDLYYWTIRENRGIGRVYARSMVYKQQNQFYSQKICLPYDLRFRFDFTNLTDEGYYRVRNDRGELLFSGSGNYKVKTNNFFVGPNPNPQDIHIKLCHDQKGRFRWKKGNGKPSNKRSCHFIKKEGYCNLKGLDGKPMWERCKKSCRKCSA